MDDDGVIFTSLFERFAGYHPVVVAAGVARF
jgi:hypothetical protein